MSLDKKNMLKPTAVVQASFKCCMIPSLISQLHLQGQLHLTGTQLGAGCFPSLLFPRHFPQSGCSETLKNLWSRFSHCCSQSMWSLWHRKTEENLLFRVRAHWITTVPLGGICQGPVAHVNFSQTRETVSVLLMSKQVWHGKAWVSKIPGICSSRAHCGLQVPCIACIPGPKWILCLHRRGSDRPDVESDMSSSHETGSAGHSALLTFPFHVGFGIIFVTPELLWKSLPDFWAVNKKYGATETKTSSKLARLLSSWWFFMNRGVCRYLIACVCLGSVCASEEVSGYGLRTYRGGGRERGLRRAWREGIWLCISRIQVLLFDNIWSQGEKFCLCTCSQRTLPNWYCSLWTFKNKFLPCELHKVQFYPDWGFVGMA